MDESIKLPEVTFQPNMVSVFNRRIREDLKLYEGLIRTYPVDDTIVRLRHIGVSDNYVKTEFENGTPLIYIFTTNNLEHFNKINQTMETYGWIFSSGENHQADNEKDIRKLLSLDKDNNGSWLKYVAKFDYEIGLVNRPKYLYHVTPKSRLDKIMKIGLTPKSKNKISNQPDRIYLIPYNNQTLITNIIEELFAKEDLVYQYKKEYCLLELYIPESPPLRLFKDIDMDGALYSMDNIKPENIQAIQIYFLNENGKVYNVINNKIK